MKIRLSTTKNRDLLEKITKMPPPSRSQYGGASSSQSSNYADEGDVRFVDLLKPIKDLTTNWSVPLSNYLTQYYEEIKELELELDGQTAKVNFAEAALFLQGTVSVYSKKVEFLWQNVLQMLDLLASKKALEADNEEGDDEAGDGSGRKRKKGAQLDPNEFDLVSISVAKNTNLKSEVKESVHSRKMNLKFIFVTPRQLIEKEGKEQKMTRIDLYVKTAGKYDLLGQKEEFRVNSQFALRTGMIGEELCAESELAQQSVSLCEDSDLLSSFERTLVGGENRTSGEMIRDLEVVEEEIVAFEDDHLDQPPSPLPPTSNSAIMPPDSTLVNGLFPSSSGELEDASEPSEKKRKTTTEDLLNEPKAPLEDSWQPLEPHEVVTIPKPIRKGRRKVKPADIKQLQTSRTRDRSSIYNCSNNNESRLKVTTPIEEFLMQDLQKNKSGCANVIIESNLAPALIDEAIAHIKSRSKKSLAIKDKEEHNNQEEVQNENVEENDQNADDVGDDQGLADLNMDDAPAENDDHDFDCDDNDLNQIPEAFRDNSDDKEKETNNKEEEKETERYEDLVLKRVSEYVAQSQDYIQSTELAKRVRAWHDSLGPKLEAVEKRGDFDIHEYGSKILKKFPEGSRKTTIDFQDVIDGDTPEEVSRLFLSSLMLANAQNVEIQCTASKDVPLPMDQVSLTLLSTERHHEHMMENIPDVEQPVKRKKAAKKKLKPIPEQDEEDEAVVVEDDNLDELAQPLPIDDFEQHRLETLEAFNAIPVAQRGQDRVNVVHHNGVFVIPSTSKSSTSSSSKGKKKTIR